MTVITFYDLTSNKGPFSPFTWRVRLALNFKRIPYKTHWLTLAEIEPYFKTIGVPPTGRLPDDSGDFYTCPVIQTTDGKIVAGSDAIVDFLEQAFPDSPSLFATGTRALQAAYVDLFASQVLTPAVQILVPGVPAVVDPASADYFRSTRLKWYGMPLEEWVPLGSEKRKNAWKAAEEGWGKLAAVHRKSEGVWLTGARPVFADFVMLAVFCFMHKVIPVDEWQAALAWNDGVWSKLWHAGQVHMNED